MALDNPVSVSPPNCCYLRLFFRSAARYRALARKELGALRRRAGLPRSPLRGTNHAASGISEILASLLLSPLRKDFVI